jgi:hypothetical protein
MRKTILCALVGLAAMLANTPAMAHHSANAQFDTSKEFTITGTLTKVENVNPHSWWHVDVKGPDGKVTSWRLESLGPAGLIRQGLRVKTDIKIGETFTFRISPAWKDPEDAKMGFMKAITFNGKEYVVIEL